MKAKSLLLLSLLAMPIRQTIAAENTGSAAGLDFSAVCKGLQNPIVGAGAGWTAAWALKHFGAEKVTALPVVSHLFMVATDQERAFMFDNLELLGAVVGALVTTGHTTSLLYLTKAAVVCDLMQRVMNRDLSVQSLGYAARDLAWVLDAHHQLPEGLQKSLRIS